MKTYILAYKARHPNEEEVKAPDVQEGDDEFDDEYGRHNYESQD